MKLVKPFEKRVYVGKGYECNRLIKKWRESGVANRQDFSADEMKDDDVYGIYIGQTW